MMTLFNRRELITTFSMEKQAKVRDILSQNGIEYRVRTNSHPSGSTARGRTGTYGLSADSAYQYSIYVHKQDYDKAVYLINK